MLYKKDIVTCHFYNNTPEDGDKKSIDNLIPHVLVSNGKRRKSKILYGVVVATDLPFI